MTPDEFAQHYHKMRFQLACNDFQGTAFQSFFEKIMQKYDRTFVSVRPAGKEGDWKSDGFSQGTGTIYQCFAPEKLTGRKASEKIKQDFHGAKREWGDKMKCWVFVYSSVDKLQPQAVAMIEDIRKENPDLEIESWNREALWIIVLKLTTEQRTDLLGIIPEINQVPDITAAEIQTLLNYLLEQHVELIEDTVEHIELADKILRNGLDNHVRREIQIAMPVARRVDDYVRKHPDSRYSLKIGSVLAEKYQFFAKKNEDKNDIFYKLIDFTTGNGDKAKLHWAAVGIISYYFQLCDIFER